MKFFEQTCSQKNQALKNPDGTMKTTESAANVWEILEKKMQNARKNPTIENLEKLNEPIFEEPVFKRSRIRP